MITLITVFRIRKYTTLVYDRGIWLQSKLFTQLNFIIITAPVMNQGTRTESDFCVSADTLTARCMVNFVFRGGDSPSFHRTKLPRLVRNIKPCVTHQYAGIKQPRYTISLCFLIAHRGTMSCSCVLGKRRIFLFLSSFTHYQNHRPQLRTPEASRASSVAIPTRPPARQRK